MAFWLIDIATKDAVGAKLHGRPVVQTHRLSASITQIFDFTVHADNLTAIGMRINVSN
jgi:hypothetical protein